MQPNLITRLLELGFQQKSKDVFERGDVIKMVASTNHNCLVIEVGIKDPFFEETPPFYVTSFRGELRHGGVQTNCVFLANYESAMGSVSANLEDFEKHGVSWIERFSELKTVSVLFDDSLQKRQAKAAANVPRSLLRMLLPKHHVGERNVKPPPLYNYIKSLLCFHLSDFEAALTFARRYQDTFTSGTNGDVKKAIARMIEYLASNSHKN